MVPVSHDNQIECDHCAYLQGPWQCRSDSPCRRTCRWSRGHSAASHLPSGQWTRAGLAADISAALRWYCLICTYWIECPQPLASSRPKRSAISSTDLGLVDRSEYQDLCVPGTIQGQNIVIWIMSLLEPTLIDSKAFSMRVTGCGVLVFGSTKYLLR
jgi:hypothetical protein